MESTENPRRPLELVAFQDGARLACCLLRPGKYGIGCARKNEVVVAAPSVSAQHARLLLDADDGLTLEDLASANGTFVDGRAITSATRISLGSVIEIGAVTLCFERGGLPVAAADLLPAHFLRAQRYELGELVVQGSTSVIHQARDTALGREIALRTLLPASQRDAAVVLRFVREAQLTSQLSHAGILPVYDFGRNDAGQLFLTTRFIASESLAAILERIAAGDRRTAERYDLPALLGIWQKVGDVLAAAHSRGVAHLFLTADAVEIARFGEVFVTQWTFAAVFAAPAEGPAIEAPDSAPTPPLTTSSAPEQAAGKSGAGDARTDIFALGALLYRIITLRAPLVAASDEALPGAVRAADITFPARESACPHWPRGRFPEFPAAVAMKALSAAREARQASVIELQQEIAAWQNNLGAESDRAPLWKQFTGLLHRPPAAQ